MLYKALETQGFDYSATFIVFMCKKFDIGVRNTSPVRKVSY